MPSLRKITSHYQLTPQGLMRGAILSFESDGTLAEISTADSPDNMEGVEFFSGLLVPGMVNTHCHLELSYLKGRIPRMCGFAGFADAMSANRKPAVPEGAAAGACGVAGALEIKQEAASYRDAKMYSEGIIAVGDVCNGTSTFQLKKKSKIHYHNFIELFGLRTTDCSPVRETAAAAETLGLTYTITPHSTYSLQDAPFKAVCSGKCGNADPLSIHFMESEGESLLFKGHGPLYERNRRENIAIDFAGYGSPADRIIASVPKGKKLLLIHNTRIDENTIIQLTDHFGRNNVTFVLCPRSNEYIEGAYPPVEMLWKAGVNISIGTDSLASNNDLSLITELVTIHKNTNIPLEDILNHATIDGAKALGIDSWAGSFEKGKKPGATLITNIDWNTRKLTPTSTSRRVI